MILTIAGKCAFCHASGEYVDQSSEGTYGWRHNEPVCELFKGALTQATNVKPLTDGIGWEVTHVD
jgi:hypothetical protein